MGYALIHAPLLSVCFQNKRRENEKLFGNLPEHADICDEVGLDTEGARDILMDKIIPSVQQVIRKLIQFARTLPGFCELSCDDQIALIRGLSVRAFTQSLVSRINQMLRREDLTWGQFCTQSPDC